MSHVLVVGAGVAGSLGAARLVEAGHTVRLVDKSYLPGGRVATRRVGGAVFDHGAQFLTAKTDRFRALVDAWSAQGVVREWFHGSPDREQADGPDGAPRFRGSPAMRRIGEHLVEGLDVALATQVERIESTDRGWRLRYTERAGGTGAIDAHAVLLTAPVPQALALLDAGSVRIADEHRHELDGITYDPCFAVLVVPGRRPDLPARGALRLQQGPIHWIVDNQVTGASPVPAVTIHAGAEYSRDRFDAAHDEVGREIEAAARLLLSGAAEVVHVHRWRYANPLSAPVGDADASSTARSIVDGSGPAPIAFAGDGLAGGRIEGAALSGLDAAERLIALLAARP